MTSNYHTIYILGGHKLSFSYYEKILHAQNEKLISFNNIYLIDADNNCYAQQNLQNKSHFIQKSPADFICDYLIRPDNYHPQDTLIPDHTAKHVMLQTALKWMERSLPTLKAQLTPIVSDFSPPFVYKSENDALLAVSHATWTCPPDCDEPAVCPHTQSTRTWDFDREIQTKFGNLPNTMLLQFCCSILAYEVAQIPMMTVVKNFSELSYALQNQTHDQFIVATNSHCHGILGQFEIKH